MANTAPATAGAKNAAPVLGPFRGGTQPTTFSTGFNQTITMTSATQPLNDYEVAPTNILRAINIEVTGTTSGNAATVAFNADAPLNVLSTINFHDSSGNAIVGPFDTYTLAMAMKYFGYHGNGDPRNNAVYSVTTGSGATGGSFTVVFRIPVEAVARTGVGSLQNQSTQSPLVISATLNTTTATYSTAPTAAPSVNVKYRLLGYWNGDNAGFSPTPKAFGSTQFINTATIQGLNGSVNQQLPNNGLGMPSRNFMFINRLNSTSARAGSGTWPDPLQVTFKGNNLVQHSLLSWQYEMSEQWDLSGTIDTGSGLDTGVFVLPFTQDFGQAPGAELGLGYLQTNVGDAVTLVGSWSAQSNLSFVNNFISVKGAPGQIQGLV